MKCTIHPNFQELTAFISNLPEHFAEGGRLIYEGRNQLKVFVVENVSVNVKAFRQPNWVNRFVYTFLRRSKARRSYENALRLLDLGFTVPQPLGYVERYTCGLLDNAYFISLQWPFTTDFRPFRTMDEQDVRPWLNRLEAFGAYVGRLHEAGVLHKDLSIGNVLMVEDKPDIFCLVDLNRMRFGLVDQIKGCANFGRLRGGTSFFKAMAKGYAVERGFDETTCFRLMWQANAKSLRFFARKARRKQWQSKQLQKWFKHVEKRGSGSGAV